MNKSTVTTEDSNNAVARDLEQALVTSTAVAPVADRLGGSTPEFLHRAYEVQELIVSGRESANNPRVGRKVGLTSPAVQTQLGVDQPDFGVLLADMEVPNRGALPSTGLIAPKVEAEVAFFIGEDLDDASISSVRAAVTAAVPALEIVDSRIADWKISIVDTVADNASSAFYVLGDHSLPLEEVDTAGVEMETRINGEVASTGTGRDCLDDPINALAWVAQTAIELGRPLRAGEVVLSGALGPMTVLNPGDVVEATITGLGSVSVTRPAATEPQS